MATQRRILIASHSPTCTTGYGRVTRRLAHAFRQAGHAVAVAGCGYAGGPHDLPYRLLPWPEKRPAESLAAALRELSPDVLLTIGDPWMFQFLPDLPERRGARWVAYFPVDGRPLPREWKKWVEAVDTPVVFCRFTRDLVAEAVGRAPALIYHGVDSRRFVPQDKLQAKEAAHVAGHFVVGTVARNQQRKNLPALLRAFAKFAQGKEDVLLYLHTQVRGEWDLAELSRRLGIEDKTRVTADLGGGSGVPDALLATVYNAMDLFVLPTMAEGFGLPIVEAQACGVPALVTDYSACPELVPDEIQRLRLRDTLVMHRNFEQAVVDVDDIAEKLEHFYRGPKELQELGRRCREFVKQFEWEKACGQFVELINSFGIDSAGINSLAPVPRGEGRGEGLSSSSDVGRPNGRSENEETANAQRPTSNVEREAQSPLTPTLSPEYRGEGVNSEGANDVRLETAPGGWTLKGSVASSHVATPQPGPTLDAARGHERAGRFADAESACRRLLVRDPRDAGALHLLGVVRGRMGDAEEATKLLEQTAELCPKSAEVLNDLGVVWETRGDFDRAAECFARAAGLRPRLHVLWVNLSNALAQSGRAGATDAAVAAARRAMALRSDNAAAHNAHGVALVERGEAVQAKLAFAEAVRLKPDYPQARANLGLALLRGGDFANGWREHEWRRADKGRFPPRPGREWGGEELKGRSILLYGEGGLGNVIQFARFAPLLSARGAEVTVQCQPELVGLLRTMQGVRVVARGAVGEKTDQEPGPGGCHGQAYPLARAGCEAMPGNDGTEAPEARASEYTCPWHPGNGDGGSGNGDGGGSARATAVPPPPQLHCPLMSVPAMLGTAEADLPNGVPYLHPEPQWIERWAGVLRGVTGLRVGVCWRGDQGRPHMRDRSFDPALLRALAEVPGVSLVNLQHGEPPLEGLPLATLPGLEPVGPESMRLEDAAAVMKGLGLVISCDTCIAHLAGALGVPAWVALKSSACWRWMSDRDDSPWYPSLRLFRQWEPGDWAGVLARMAKALAALAAPATQPRPAPSAGAGAAGPVDRPGTGAEAVESARPVATDQSPFAYFGTALVLNLDADAERMQRTVGRLGRLDIPFERFAAFPAPADLVSRDPCLRAGHYACAMTHRAALLRAMGSGVERVLIFEDDVLLRDDADLWLRRIVPQLRQVEWDVFYLGLHLEQSGKRLGDNLIQVHRGFHGHAYAVARDAMPRMIAFIDRVLAALAGTFDGYEDPTLLKVCATPILAVQEPSYSHSYGRKVDRLGQYFTRFDGDDFRSHCREMADSAGVAGR